jgi:hypothetical protein
MLEFTSKRVLCRTFTTLHPCLLSVFLFKLSHHEGITRLSCQDMSGKINDLFNLLNHFLQSIPKNSEISVPEQQPETQVLQPADAGHGMPTRPIKSKDAEGSDIAAKSHDNSIVRFLEPSISNELVSIQDRSKPAFLVSGNSKHTLNMYT